MSLAGFYDRLQEHVDYSIYVNVFEDICAKNGVSPVSVADLGCGTGEVCRILEHKGYDVTGVDMSDDMLNVVRAKIDTNKTLLLRQRIESLDLNDTVDAFICTRGSMHYIETEKKFAKALERIRLFLNPGGLFVFDWKEPDVLRRQNNTCNTLEAEGVYCVWQSFVRGNTCSNCITMFIEERGKWSRHEEFHMERSYPDVLKMLEAAGFCKVYIHRDKRLNNFGAGLVNIVAQAV